MRAVRSLGCAMAPMIWALGVGVGCAKAPPANAPSMSAGSGGASVATGGAAAAASGGAGGVSTGGAPGSSTGGMAGSGTDAAATDAPVVDAPVIDAPTIDLPVIDLPAVDAAATDAAVTDAPPQFFETRTLAIAAEYLTWGRIDDELRWAPYLCRQPLPGVAHSSASNDPSTHGQKLYSVFAKHRDNYPAGPQDDQVVVKQSWKTELVTEPDASYNPGAWRADGGDGGDHFYPYARNDGGVYRATEPAGLFVMFKLDPATPETDEGWVYATVSPAGEVTSSGRVASCMGCHEASATYERLYGVSKNP